MWKFMWRICKVSCSLGFSYALVEVIKKRGRHCQIAAFSHQMLFPDCSHLLGKTNYWKLLQRFIVEIVLLLRRNLCRRLFPAQPHALDKVIWNRHETALFVNHHVHWVSVYQCPLECTIRVKGILCFHHDFAASVGIKLTLGFNYIGGTRTHLDESGCPRCNWNPASIWCLPRQRSHGGNTGSLWL